MVRAEAVQFCGQKLTIDLCLAAVPAEFQSTQQSQGIQTLLEAEKEAAKVVQKARQCTSLIVTHHIPRCPSSHRDCALSSDRVQKLKDARSEAAKEIEAYKVQKQKEYEAYESEVCSL